MCKHLTLLLVLLIAGATGYSQNISGTWHGFQVSMEKGRPEYRVMLDITLVDDDDVTGTMQLKSSQKGTIISSFTGKIDRRDGLLYLHEDSILTEGITPRDASLCSFVLKMKGNSLVGNGRSSQKGFDHLKLRLQRRGRY